MEFGKIFVSNKYDYNLHYLAKMHGLHGQTVHKYTTELQ